MKTTECNKQKEAGGGKEDGGGKWWSRVGLRFKERRGDFFVEFVGMAKTTAHRIPM